MRATRSGESALLLLDAIDLLSHRELAQTLQRGPTSLESLGNLTPEQFERQLPQIAEGLS